MSTAFGLLGLIAFIACVIALAMGVTWAVVKISPGSGSNKNDTPA
jgi:hypothetical protein